MPPSTKLFLARAISAAFMAVLGSSTFAQQEQTREITTSIVNSPIIEQLQRQAATSNARVVGEIESPTIGAAPPKVVEGSKTQAQRYLDRMRFGKHMTVSPNGEEVIAIIRDTLNPASRDAALHKLKNMVESNVPEAMNYFGFLHEYGLFQFPKNANLAQSYYSKAANMGYQPALYNLGKNQFYANDEIAFTTVQQAAEIGLEVSSRVCGLASYLAMRANRLDAAISYANKCNSPLAGFGKAQNEPNIEVKVELLRRTLSTGATDGYAWLQSATRNLKPDPQLLYCKYSLVSKYRLKSSNWQNIDSDAQACLKTNGNDVNNTQKVSGFVKAEIAAIQKMKEANKFHFSWSVPFLPFTQSEVDLYSPIMK